MPTESMQKTHVDEINYNLALYLEETAERFPDNTALEDMDSRMSYGELRKIAGRIGYELNKEEGTENPIGVIVSRDIYTIIYILGVLYSGNFYVPIDPDAPDKKINDIIDETKMKVILGNPEYSNFIEKHSISSPCRFKTLSYFNDFTSSKPVERKLEDPAYLIFTSGSTGKPKGILKSHGAMRSFIEAYTDTFKVNENDVIGNQTPFFFDASSKDIYTALKTGASLCVIPTKLFSFPPDLVDFMNLRKISVISWVPAAYSIVAQVNTFKIVKTEYLRLALFVGEVMPVKHLNKWKAALPEVKFVNLYGQSELAGICCYYIADKEYPDDAVLPMGKTLKNSTIHLMDENGHEIKEACAVGEIYLVSNALALEYYHDEEKTNNCFLYRDFGNGKERCFKTGDLAKYNENGDLEFSSRTDFQIKHMGNRIELGEIEAAASSLDDIAFCCCLYNKEKKKIILFCQLSEGTNTTATEIRSKLKTKLSDYMVPRQVIILEKMPLNANGKIDRNGLKNTYI